MEESELEEGEACSYNNNNDYGGFIDPDTDLSYIDEKLHNVLGHLQKDFEGGVSAENLGAKFGGYGSFLPTYQRSPVWSHPKTPTKLTLTSPNNLLSERGIAPPSIESKKVRPVHAFSSCSTSKALSSTDSANPKKSMKSKKSNLPETSNCRKESGKNVKPVIFSKQNSLKLRIKVGSENLKGEKNAAIYSGLGLDVSPSSSFDNSLSESEEMYCESRDSPFESPTSILTVMTSLPVEDHLLSPLSDELIRFIERQKVHKDKYTSPSTESFHDISNGLKLKYGEENPSIQKKRKSFSVAGNGRNKKIERDSLYPTAVDTAKSSGNGGVKSKVTGNGERGLWIPNQHKDVGLDENLRTSSAGSVQDDKKTRSLDCASEGKHKGRRISGSDKNLSASMAKTGHNSELEDSLRKQKIDGLDFEPQLKENRSSNDQIISQSSRKEVRKEARKVEDTYKDFFGEMEESEEDDNGCSFEVKGSQKSVRVTEKGSFPLIESHPEELKNPVPPPKPGSDVSLVNPNPVFIQENWVACDKCGKWRLLPFGILPKNLPEKWMCAMLNWLPGMNSCNVPEDETTKAIWAMYQAPVVNNQAVTQSNPVGVNDFTKKRKKGVKEINSGINRGGSQTAEINKKNDQESARNGSDLGKEKQKHKLKEQSDGGELRSLKMKSKRDGQRESSLLAKKIKTENFLFPDQDHGSGSGSGLGHDGTRRGARPNSSDGSEANRKRNSHGFQVSENEKHRIYKNNAKSEKRSKSNSKREFGNFQNSVTATSSSSKISDSYRAKNSIHESKASPVESVSSSPMKRGSIRSRKKEESQDINIISAVSLKRFSDGEEEKHGSHESSVLDFWDKQSNLKAKRFDSENDLPRKLDHEEGRQQTNDHRYRKSGKGSSFRSRDKNQSIRSDLQEKKKHETESQTDRPNIPKQYDVERTLSEKSNKADMISEKETSQSRPLSAPKKVDQCGKSADDVSKTTTQNRKKNNNSAISLQNNHSPSPLRKELTCFQAAHNALKEAKDLKHTADRLKNSVTNLEHIELYFQACLKFLHGAFLLEMSSNESTRQGETMVQSMKIYSSTANLCGFCAHEYEKSKDMGAAALAYKCMEVAHMRVVNSSYISANRYRNELQTSLHMIPPGESPSSSASDVDNLNHSTIADKVGTSKGVSSPLVAGNHIITVQNRSNLLRLLQFAQDVSLAMDASRKSRVALAASIGNLGETQEGDGIVSIKRALDYNFQDIEGLLRLVRLAMEANNH